MNSLRSYLFTAPQLAAACGASPAVAAAAGLAVSTFTYIGVTIALMWGHTLNLMDTQLYLVIILPVFSILGLLRNIPFDLPSVAALLF